MLYLTENYNLKNLNTFGVESYSRHYAEIGNSADIIELAETGLLDGEYLILGGGSNILLTKDFEGTVVHLISHGIMILEEDTEKVLVEARGGHSWADFVEYCHASGFWGLENLAFIPGSVGAAPVQNIGAYGSEQSDFFESLVCFDLEKRIIIELGKEECAFGYRDSVFKNTLKDNCIVLAVRYRLSKSPIVNLTYKELHRKITERNIAEPAPEDVLKAVQDLRQCKLPSPEELGNAGSFFKNPIVEQTKLNELQAQYEKIPYYPASNGCAKLSAAWLIERCGWKGFRKNDAGVFERHSLILVNYGKARGNEIFSLANDIQQSVKAKFGILLTPEVKIV